jgi:hypothetical protein
MFLAFFLIHSLTQTTKKKTHENNCAFYSSHFYGTTNLKQKKKKKQQQRKSNAEQVKLNFMLPILFLQMQEQNEIHV